MRKFGRIHRDRSRRDAARTGSSPGNAQACGSANSGWIAGTGHQQATVEPGRIEVREIPRPEPAAGEVLVRMEGSGVCASNLEPWAGQPWFEYPFPPGAPGHEGWGVVEETGAGVKRLEPGVRVSTVGDRAYATHQVVPADEVVALPSELEGRVFPGEPLACAMNIFERSRIEPGDRVAVVGVGFLGALLTQLAVATGARVLGLSRRSYSLEVAQSAGAEQTLATDDPDAVVEAVEEWTDGRLCDVVIEATGKQAPLDLAARLTRVRGRLVIAGYHQDGPRQVDMQLWNWRGLDVINAHERDPAAYTQGIRRAVAAVKDGRLDPSPLYTHRYPLEQLDEALNRTAEHEAGFVKALIDLSTEGHAAGTDRRQR